MVLSMPGGDSPDQQKCTKHKSEPVYRFGRLGCLVAPFLLLSQCSKNGQAQKGFQFLYTVMCHWATGLVEGTCSLPLPLHRSKPEANLMGATPGQVCDQPGMLAISQSRGCETACPRGIESFERAPF